MRKILAHLEEEYPILLGANALSKISNYIKGNKVLAICDSVFKDSPMLSNISNIGGDVKIHYMDAKKENKTLENCAKIYTTLEKMNFSRDCTVVAIGGGVIGDLGGFVASTWYRGVNFIQVPTTLMAMVDSSIGGKVAINFGNTINGIGNYYHPVANLMDTDFIKTLSKRDYASGLSEVIKCAIISDEDFFTYLQDNRDNILSRSPKHLLDIIERTARIKLDFVMGDVKENNKRLMLNYGHTLGHSVEISTMKDGREQLRHGEGVSMGMVAASYIAQEHLGGSDLEKVVGIVEDFGLPAYVTADELGFDRESLLNICMDNVKRDKKRDSNGLKLILSDKIGKADIYTDVSDELILDAFKYIIR